MLEITKENFHTEVEEYRGLVVLDLWASWCGPCRMMAPVMEEIEAEHPDVKFGKINVDEQPELAAAFRVESIPMIAFVKDNTFLDMSIGYVPKASIEKLIKEHQ